VHHDLGGGRGWIVRVKSKIGVGVEISKLLKGQVRMPKVRPRSVRG
jgi:hypothetical protein